MAILDEVLQTLEIQPTGIPTVVRLSQNENGRQIRLTLRGQETNFPAGCVVTIAGTKPDGVVYSASGSLDGNVAVINEDTQMTAVSGMWKARVNVTYGGSTIATELIVFEVYADPVDPGSVPSESELNGLVAEAQYWAENARSSAYGSPLVAETAAEMIETDRVYVYTGSETGYTAGHWYYYDGSAWADGGIYNAAAVQTDTTLSVPGMAADAKATGDAIAAEATRATAAEGAIAADVAEAAGDIEDIQTDLTGVHGDIDALEAVVPTKADKDGNYTDLTAGTALAVLSDSYTVDAVPYKFRRTPYKSRRLMDSIIGGTVAWNQLCNGASVSVPNGHKYLSKIADAWTIGASTGAAITGLTAGADMVIDLTQMFGTTIADYIYSLETATAGAGVALFRSLFPNAYYAYNAGELVSISGLSAHKTTGFNQWDEEWENGAYNSTGEKYSNADYIRSKNYIPVLPSTTYYFKAPTRTGRVNYYDSSHTYIDRSNSFGNNTFVTPANCRYVTFFTSGTTYNHDICISISDPAKNGTYEPYEAHTYPLDSTLTLRGIPKLDSANRLYFDGDTYASDGTVTRKYGIVDLVTLTWTARTDVAQGMFSVRIDNRYQGATAQAMCAKYPYNGTVPGVTAAVTANPSFSFYNGGTSIYVYDTAYTDAATFKASLSGVYLVYELATATTETAEPYINPQYCNYVGTEEYISETVVPVGHESRYYRDLDAVIPEAPTADGTYVLKCTVSGGVASYAWEVTS